VFRDRSDAGRALADALAHHAHRPDVVVLALPRGGVPVASEVALALGAPLDVFLVRKLGSPGNPELAMGAIASGGVRVLEPRVIDALGISGAQIDAVSRTEIAELERRERAYRGERPAIPLAGKTVILIDDGLATGATMRAAVRAVKNARPARVVVAVPIGAPEACAEIRGDADEVICAVTPRAFRAVGLWYEDFSQTTDEEVQHLLAAHRGEEPWESSAPIRSSTPSLARPGR